MVQISYCVIRVYFLKQPNMFRDCQNLCLTLVGKVGFFFIKLEVSDPLSAGLRCCISGSSSICDAGCVRL